MHPAPRVYLVTMRQKTQISGRIPGTQWGVTRLQWTNIPVDHTQSSGEENGCVHIFVNDFIQFLFYQFVDSAVGIPERVPITSGGERKSVVSHDPNQAGKIQTGPLTAGNFVLLLITKLGEKTNTMFHTIHPDSSGQLHRSHKVQYCCGCCKLVYLLGYSVASMQNWGHPISGYLGQKWMNPVAYGQIHGLMTSEDDKYV